MQWRTRRDGARPIVIVVLSGGGFTFETACLLSHIAHGFEFVYLATPFGGAPGEGQLPPGECHPIPSFATKTRRSLRQSLMAFALTFKTTLRVIQHRQVAAVIAVGCSHAVPMLLAGRILRVPTVFVESITRVRNLSNTGRIVYHGRLASLYVIQWPELQARYRSSFLGTIL